MFIIGGKTSFICYIIGLKFGELGRRLLIIQKLFFIFYSQSYKFLVELTILVTASLRCAVVSDPFYLDSFTATPTSS